MEKIISSPRALFHCLSLSELIGFFILNSILIWVTNFISDLLMYSSITYTKEEEDEEEEHKKNDSLNEAEHDQKLKMEDVEIVMEKMGMRFDERIGLDGIVSMFEEEEPSFGEVKEAFGVFDENSDGFIDAVELQRVLCKLGYKEGEDMDACKLMIERYDENRDGKIDFYEFAKFMESSLLSC